MLDLSTFTLVHVAISLLGIIAGLVLVGGLVAGVRLDRWFSLFLVTTAFTSLTGFGFPNTSVTPAQVVGGLSLVILALAAAARHWKKLAGAWRSAFVISSVAALYLNMFVLVVQLFAKTPALKELAPTQSEAPFAATQVLLLALFVWLGRGAVAGIGRGVPPGTVRPDPARAIV
jgi:hypothetical protein